MKVKNKSTNHFKTPALLLVALTMLMNNRLAWSACYVDSINLDIYRLTGEYETKSVCDASYNCVEQPDLSNPIIKIEYGTLFVKEGFIPSGSRGSNLRALGGDIATIQAVNGKPIDDLAGWTIGSPIYNCFARSTELYTFDGVPHVTISVKGSDGGTGGGTGGVIIKGKPTVSLSADQANASETGPTSGRFLIKFDAPRSKKISVSYAITGTAKNNKDYKKIKGSVSIPSGQTSATIEILPIDDFKKELTEKVTLKLNTSGTYKVNKSQKAATVEITDND